MKNENGEDKVLGRGSFGQVVLMRDSKNNDALVAVKLLLRNSDSEANTALNEALKMKELHHPNIVELLDVFIVAQPQLQLCTVLEYCTEGDLETHLEKMKTNPSPVSNKVQIYEDSSHLFTPSPCRLLLLVIASSFLILLISSDDELDFQVQVSMMKQLASALYYLHIDKRMLHRDIKATNVLVTLNNNELVLKLTDFGLATLLTMDSVAHTVAGTPFFIAPEVIDRQPYSRPADIFSLGML